MERLSKKVQTSAGEIEVFEITPKDIKALVPLIANLGDNFSLENGHVLVKDFLPRMTSLTLEQATNLRFSDYDKTEIAWREINSSFLRRCSQAKGIMAFLGLEAVLKQMVDAITQTIQATLSSSLATLTPPTE
jgi:hypothetical protein